MIDISGHLRNYRRDFGFSDNENYITVNCCGFQKFITKNFTVLRESGRLDYQIIYITKGKGIFYLDGVKKYIPEGNVIIYKPGQYQHYTYSFEDFTEAYWVHFSGYGSKDFLLKSQLIVPDTFFIGVDNECIELYKNIIYELQIKKTVYEQIANSYFLELLARISRRLKEISQGVVKNRNSNLQKVLEVMHTKYYQKFTIKDFAALSNLSQYRFIHNFKNFTGMSPMEYLTEIRIDKARELLLSSTLGIGEISGITGYENQLYFSRIFKKFTGMSPSLYRKNTK